MPNPENNNQQSLEGRESKEQLNSFPLNVDKAGKELMQKWNMEIKNDAAYVNGQHSGTEFRDVKTISITAVNNVLIQTEVGTDGSVIISKGSSPRELIDNAMYKGIQGYLKLHSGEVSQDYKKKLEDALKDLDAKYPNFKSE